MKYKPESVKLVVTHNGIEQEVSGITDYPISFDESTYIEKLPPKKTIVEVMWNDECSVMTEEQLHCLLCEISKTKEASKEAKPKPKRCKDNIDWVEEEYGDAYEKPYVNKKPKKCSQSCKQSIHSTLVKQLTKSEIESLRQNKRDAYALMMKMN